MNTRGTIIGLIVAIVALAGIHLSLDINTHEAPMPLRRSVLERRAETATCFTLTRADEPTVRLEKRGGWKVTAPFLAEAETLAILRLSDALAFVPITDEMTDAELLRIGRTREDFGLEKPRLVVTVGNLAETAVTTIGFGSLTPTGNGVYAAVGNLDAVYVVPTNVLMAANRAAKEFRRRRIVATQPENVTSFDIKNGSSRFVRIMRRDKNWKVAEPESGVITSTSRITEFLNGLCNLEAREFVWTADTSNETTVASATMLAGFGLDAESAITVTLELADGKPCPIAFGREAGNGLVYVLLPEGNAIVTVPDSVRRAASQGMDAFADVRLFPIEAASIASISLVDDRASYLLSRKANGNWRMDAPVSAETDATVVTALIDQLLSLKTQDVETDGIRVSIGTNASPVSVSRKALLSTIRLEDLRAKEILSLDAKLIKRLIATDRNGQSEAIVFDSAKSTWISEVARDGVTTDGPAIAALVAALAPLHAQRIERLRVTTPELGQFGLDKPVRTIAIDQTKEDAMRRNILIGEATDNGRFATVGASDAVFVIPSASATALLAPLTKKTCE